MLNDMVEKKMHGNMNDLTGKKFGRLTVLRDSGKRAGIAVKWLCKCECKKLVEVRGANLVTHKARSCGCLKKEMAGEQMRKMRLGVTGIKSPVYKHGDACGNHQRTRLYRIYNNMKCRCYNNKSPSYSFYGARGIAMCDDWLGNYSAFKFWALSHGYTDELTIDRINSDGNYEKSNCQWITQSENSKKACRERKERRL